MSTVPTPVGATLPEPKPSARDESADPDLDRWQHDRWAPHPLKDRIGKRREFVRDGSFHDRTISEAEQAEAAKSEAAPRPPARRKRKAKDSE